MSPFLAQVLGVHGHGPDGATIEGDPVYRICHVYVQGALIAVEPVLDGLAILVPEFLTISLQ